MNHLRSEECSQASRGIRLQRRALITSNMMSGTLHMGNHNSNVALTTLPDKIPCKCSANHANPTSAISTEKSLFISQDLKV